MVFLLWVCSVGAGEYTEYEVKAAYIYNFAKFTQWPEEVWANRETFRIGILGDDPFGTDLDDVVRGKSVKNLPIEVVRSDDAADMKDCLIVFISESKSETLDRILDELAGANILTVGESDDHLESGGIIRLKLKNDKVRFDISATAAKEASLEISSKLLDLADQVT